MTVSRILSIFAGAITLSAGAQTNAPIVTRTIPSQTLSPGGATLALNLSDYFSVAGVNGPVVQFDTVLGKFDVELRPDAAPKEVANFLGYVQRGDYNNSFFHRSATLDGGPISIVQGGGYDVTSSGSVATVPAQAPVPLEYNLANDRGTLAAARTSDVNSATSQWYFNVRDNSSSLGPSNGGGYTVFGRVLGSGMSVVDAIAALQRVNAGSPFDELPVRNYTSGNVQTSNLVLVNSISAASLFPTDSMPSVAGFSVQSSAPGVVNAALTGSVLALTPGTAGTATITVQATDVTGASVSTSFDVTVAAVPPSFVSQPSSYTIATGDTVVFRAAAANATSYQWQHNGGDVGGATSPLLVLHNVGAADAGNYTLIARNAIGSSTSNAATLTVNTVAASDRGRLVNLSIRSNSGIGGDVLTIGFALGGASGSAPLLLRAAGPSLAQFGVSSYLADPVATLFSGSNAIGSNDNWGGDSQVTALAQQVAAFAYSSPNSLDAAMAVSPTTGSYTMQITGNGGGTGMSLGEIYEATPRNSITAATPRLVNVSARTQVGTGDNVLVAGFVIGGSTAKTVLVRAVGPGLTQFNVPGVLADPKLQILSNGGANLLGENDDWGGDPQINAAASSVAAFTLTDGASKDAALLITLPPGNYTAQASGVNGTTGVALVEVYEVP